MAEKEESYNKSYYEANKQRILEKKKLRYTQDAEYQVKAKERSVKRWFEKVRSKKYEDMPPLDRMVFDHKNVRIVYIRNEGEDARPVKLLSMTAFAQAIGVTTATLRNWYNEEILPVPTFVMDGGENAKKWYSFRYIENVRKVLKERRYADWTSFKLLVYEEFECDPDLVISNTRTKSDEEAKQMAEHFDIGTEHEFAIHKLG